MEGLEDINIYDKNDKFYLLRKQKEFELAEKERIKNKDNIKIIETKKNKLISWAVIIAIFMLVFILGIILL